MRRRTDRKPYIRQSGETRAACLSAIERHFEENPNADISPLALAEGMGDFGGDFPRGEKQRRAFASSMLREAARIGLGGIRKVGVGLYRAESGDSCRKCGSAAPEGARYCADCVADAKAARMLARG